MQGEHKNLARLTKNGRGINLGRALPTNFFMSLKHLNSDFLYLNDGIRRSYCILYRYGLDCFMSASFA